MNRIFYLSLFISLLAACNPSSNGDMESETNSAPKKQNSDVAPIMPLTNTQKKNMIENCNGIEATFYFTGQSMSTADCSSMFSMLDIAIPNSLTKKEYGHIMFLNNGNMITLAKIHLSETENYLEFNYNDTAYYANLNESGVNFLSGLSIKNNDLEAKKDSIISTK